MIYPDFLPWRVRCFLMRQYFARNSVTLKGLPNIKTLMPQIENSGHFSVGENVTFRGVRLQQRISIWKGASLDIANDVFINDGVNICATLHISISSHTKIGDQTYIYDSDFHQVSPDVPIRRTPVTIGRNVWIGANSMVLAGSSIGENSVIAAGSIVTSSIPPNCLAGGSPAKVLRSLQIPEGWIRP